MPDNQELANLIARHGLADRCHLLGRRDDLSALTPALDLATLTSLSEGFPNVLGEALACGVPCVATDVGDSGVLLDEAGEVVPCGDPQALVAAWERFLAMTPEQRRQVGAKGRATIRSRYSLDRMVTAFEDLYMTLVQRL
jgi:glycosyltransferase involved in cell wall biosynthesis